MNVRVVFLATTTLLFAGSTAWLALELRAERQRIRSAEPVVGKSASARSTVVYSTAAKRDEARQSTATSQSQGATSPAQNGLPGYAPRNVSELVALSEATLKRIDDPREREAMLGEAKVQLRRSSPDLARYMRLSADEEEALLSVMVENGLDGSTRFAQCSHDPKCDPSAVARAESDRNHQTLQAYLGPEKYERFAAYEETMAERRDVAQLKARLPADLSLRDASSERLIAGLADERRATTAAAERQGLHTDQFGISGGNLVTRSALDGADTKARLDSAAQFSQRLRDRAADVLTSRQLEVFNQMQDEVLTIMRERLRDEEALASVRKGQEH